MVITQLLSVNELLKLNQSQLDSLDSVIEAEIIKSEECLKVLRQKLEPLIHELQQRK